MENSTVAFHGTRLLTLSACSTAKDYKSRNGLEMDGLGMVAQQKEAQAVLATLWDVNDLSTSHIMSDFYARWVKNPAQGKAEALRQAQLAFCTAAQLPLAPKPAEASRPRGLQRRNPVSATLILITGRPSSSSAISSSAGLQTRTNQRAVSESRDPNSSEAAASPPARKVLRLRGVLFSPIFQMACAPRECCRARAAAARPNWRAVEYRW